MKKKLKTLLSTVFAVVLGGGLIVNFAMDNDRAETKTIGASAYQIATFDMETKKVDKSDDAHILSNYITTDGLTIVTSEEFNVEYTLHWFDEDKGYLSSSAVQKGDWNGSPVLNAEFVRIEIDPVKDDDGIVTLFELPGYVAQLEVTVNK